MIAQLLFYLTLTSFVFISGQVSETINLSQRKNKTNTRPNIIMIIADDLVSLIIFAILNRNLNCFKN